jgi:hypothetical protein
MMRTRTVVAALCAAALLAGAANAAEKSLLASLKAGTPDLKQAGALAFAPEGILFVGDTTSAAVFAIDTGDRPAKPAEGAIKVEGIKEKIAGLLGADVKQVAINSLAVNPLSGNAYLSVTRGSGPDAMPVLLRVAHSGKIEEVALKDVKFAKATLPNPPDPAKKVRGQPLRVDTITSLGYADGKVYVAGLSNEEFSSKLRAIPFPFTEADRGASIEIYHASHRHIETNSPVRTFVPYKVGDETDLLAAYTCTPLVKVPVSALKPGEKVKGTTIAELGNMNRPLDMIVYQKDGKDYILIANSARGIMKVPTEGVGTAKAITTPVSGGGTAGIAYETIKNLKGVKHLAKLDSGHALLLVDKDGAQNLETVELP